MDCQLDIFFLEAVLNGILLAGLLALLALGLNLVFGVIDVVWICYAELVMVGMYGIHYAHKGGAPFLLAALLGILLIAAAGALLHLLVIRPVLDRRRSTSSSSPAGCCSSSRPPPPWPSGSSSGTSASGCGSMSLVDMSFSWARIVAFAVALGGMLALWLFLTRTYMGTAIRAISQDRQIMPLMGVDQRKVYLVTSAIGGGLAGLPPP